MTPEQRWQFDVDGMIVVPNALDLQQVAQMNAAMDARSTAGLEVGGSTNRVQDPHRDNPLHFSPAFRRALDNPRVAPILEELIGSGGVASGGFYDVAEQTLPTYRIDHVNLNHIEHTPGSGLHNTGDGSSHAGGSQFFQAQDRRLFNGLLVVAYELRDTIDNDGGFGCGAPTSLCMVFQPLAESNKSLPVCAWHARSPWDSQSQLSDANSMERSLRRWSGASESSPRSCSRGNVENPPDASVPVGRMCIG